ncbi:methyltransferase domain-containing protein [Aurantibacter crassamenti]|nr:methyltransferase domain-containing protein [Aurantibacter crassamenti]
MNKSEKFWNSLSKNYDKKAKDQTYDQILKRSPKYLNPDDIVLDFACATGLYSIAFANHVKKIEAFDTSSKMIGIAKDKLQTSGIENVNFSQTTLFDEYYKEGTFDTIFAFNILLYFEDVEKVLYRMNSLLKPGGTIITSTACLKEKKSIIAVFSSSVIFVLKKLRILPYLKFIGIDELKNSITNSGFNIIDSEILIEKPAIEYYIVAKKN